ncbi:GGDEF domain-containing protein [Desulfoluna spongiiphila]|uniref:diguanylate cyclase n=1 Tax=Desulfoluna spongiiphila TaxID=419481 RepID=A0A1G5F7N4_9BACT|nr:GGDEF domain-containing protein [Desulfoluna spongiiphila]SCY34638.1 diguanylate cyclase (GGDEF) domain-containing protein [Desulfoluna spongiiphila]
MMAQFNWMGEFQDPEKEITFREDQWPRVKHKMQFVYVTTAVVYLLAGFADFLELGPGPKFNLLLACRALAAMAGLTSFYQLYLNKKDVLRHTATVCVYMSAVMGTEIIELILKAPITGTMTISATSFVVLICYLFFPPRLMAPLIGGLGGSVLYIGSMIFLTPLPFTSMSTTILSFGLANCCGIYFFIHMEKTKRREFSALAELRSLVEIDELTQVYSRRKVLEMGHFFFKSARRFHTPGSVLMLDIDHFKRFNDTFGHHTGDQILAGVATRCKHALREVDSFGRLGGEEFIVFLPQCTLPQALIAAERIRTTVCNTPFHTDNGEVLVTISIGAAELQPDHADLSCLIRDADMQLYRAKAKGRNRIYHAAA